MDRRIGRASVDISADIPVDISVDISTDARPTPLDRYVGRDVDQHIGRASVDMPTDISNDMSVEMSTDISVEGFVNYTIPLMYVLEDFSGT